jgi:nicotinate-nucleotide--dimethylbenzimidazole phosphoribosyltransferase
VNSTAGIHAGAVLEAIRERRSTRRFRPEAVPHELLTELLEAARWSPSADNAQPWYLVVIRDDATKRRLNAVAAESRNLYELWSSSLPEAGRLATLPDFLEVPLCLAVFADPRQSPAYVEGEQSHILAAGLAIENIWLLAHARGLSACLWSHLEQDQMKCVLGVPHHYYFAGVLGLGYSLPDHDQPTKERQRKPLDEIVGYEWFKTRSGQAPPADKLALVRDFLHYQETLDGC